VEVAFSCAEVQAEPPVEREPKDGFPREPEGRLSAAVGPLSGGSTRRLAVRGSLWVVGSLLVIQVVKFFSNIFLARLLNPEIFGLTALAAAFAMGMEMFSDLGVSASIIQHQRGDDARFLNTAWTIQVLRGLLIGAALALIALPVAWLYEDSRLALIFVLTGGMAVLSGFNSTAIVTLNRNLAARQVCIFNVLSDVVTTGVIILVALFSPTAFAIILGWYTRSIYRLIGSHWLNRGVANRFCWDPEVRRALFTFGKWVFVSTAITFLANQTDRLLLGQLGSLAVLGVYGMALMVAAVPQQFGRCLTEMVLFPLFAKQARTDVSLLERKVLVARRLVLSAGLVATLGAMTASPWFFRLWYDTRYADAGWLAQVLCVYMWFTGLQFSADRALVAMGATPVLALANGVNAAVTVVGCIVGYWLGGLSGFTVGLCFSTLASHLVIQRALARRGIHITGQDVFYSLLLLALGTLGALGPRIVATLHGDELSLGVSLALGLPALAIAGAWALSVAWKEVVKR
jgi:O-antigen/teichoic acid export membrane protein